MRPRWCGKCRRARTRSARRRSMGIPGSRACMLTGYYQQSGRFDGRRTDATFTAQLFRDRFQDERPGIGPGAALAAAGERLVRSRAACRRSGRAGVRGTRSAHLAQRAAAAAPAPPAGRPHRRVLGELPRRPGRARLRDQGPHAEPAVRRREPGTGVAREPAAAGDRADVRRRPEPAHDAALALDPPAVRRPRDVLRDRHARAGLPVPARRDGRGRRRDRRPYLPPPEPVVGRRRHRRRRRSAWVPR